MRIDLLHKVYLIFEIVLISMINQIKYLQELN